MKRSIFYLIVLLVFGGRAFGLAPMGSLVPELSQSQWSLGFDYSYSRFDVELSGLGLTWTESNVKSNMIFANLGYGISNDWEVFLRLGLADAEVGSFDTSAEFAYGFGTKVNLGNYNNLDWGALFQINWFEMDDTYTLGGFTGNSEIEAYEIQIAVGPTYNAGNYKIYCGPFLHFINGDWDVANVSFDIEEKSSVGGFLGISTDLTSNSNISVEYQFTGNAQAVGLRYVHRF